MSNRFKEMFKEADKAFNGTYGNELNALMGLSKDEIDSVTPDTTDLQMYSILVEVVKDASRKNLSQAKLVENIKELGDLAVKIAKKVPQLASLF
jgi:vesicle coat complex subunit